MKERTSETQEKTQTFSIQSVTSYVKRYAKTCRQSYLSLLSI